MPWKKALAANSSQAWRPGTLGSESFQVASVGAAVANTTIQQLIALPCNSKISKIAVAFTAVNVVTGTHKLNVALGLTGAYSGVNPNDNSNVEGYPTNIGTGSVGLFAADIAINSANAYSATTANGTSGCAVPGTGWIVCATTGGYGIFVPDNYDAVYPAGYPLSLRVVTPASTGSLSNLTVTLLVEPIPLSPTYVPQTINNATVLPGTSF